MKQAESDQIYEAMNAKGLPVEYLLYEDEGHGFARPPNSLDFCSRYLRFGLGQISCGCWPGSGYRSWTSVLGTCTSVSGLSVCQASGMTGMPCLPLWMSHPGLGPCLHVFQKAERDAAAQRYAVTLGLSCSEEHHAAAGCL